MEEWQIDFDWLRIKHFVKQNLGQTNLPDVNTILFLIGIQELGQVKERFTKEEKQDLMHIAVCRLLESEGYFVFTGIDADGWPHYKSNRAFTMKGVKQQEALLKEKIIQYFYEQGLIDEAFEPSFSNN